MMFVTSKGKSMKWPDVFMIILPSIHIASMFGFVKNENGIMVVANRIFETLLYNWLKLSFNPQN